LQLLISSLDWANTNRAWCESHTYKSENIESETEKQTQIIS